MTLYLCPEHSAWQMQTTVYWMEGLTQFGSFGGRFHTGKDHLSLERKKMVHLRFGTARLWPALFTIAKIRKQSKCPLTDERIKKMWYVYTMEYYSAIKKNEIMPFAATWMQLEIIILSEVRKRKTNTVWYHLYVEAKTWQKWIYLWNRNRLTDIENRLAVAKGKRGWGRDGLGVWG